MEKGNNSRSQSGKSVGASNKSGGSSQPRGNNGGSGSSGSYEQHADKVVRQLAWDMAKGCTKSYPQQQFLADHFYNKFMDGDM